MNIEWMILAEGIARDADGAITAVGLNRNILIVDQLPATTKRAIIAHVLVDPGEIEVGRQISFRFTITSPSGDILTANSGSIVADKGPPWPELPYSFDVPAETMIQVRDYGAHSLSFTFETPEGENLSSSVVLYVLKPPHNSA